MTKHIFIMLLSLFIATAASAQWQISSPRDFTEVSASGLGVLPENLGLPAGAQAPDAVLENMQSEVITLSSLWRDQPLLLIFYRGGWCPYCNAQIREMTLAWPEFSQAGVQIALVSVDQPDAAALLQATYDIPFAVLSDSQMHALQAYRVVLQFDQESVDRYLNSGLDLESWSGTDLHAIAVASAFIIDTGGMIRWSHADLDFKQRPSAKQLLEVISALSLN